MSQAQTAKPTDSDVGRIVKTKFKLQKVIGKGQWGTVYLGEDLTTEERVAIKQVKLKGIPKAELTSIINEISLLQGLSHKNIVKYIDSETTESELFIVLEFVEKGSLQDQMKAFGAGGRFPEHLVVRYMEQVLQGLEYLHDQGVIHRDIKAANILSTKNDVIKVADFGVATDVDQNDETVIGTPYWMAPEIIEMQGAKKASDIWSLGCTIIELLTGKPPYYDLNQMQALFKIVQEGQPPLPDGISQNCREFLSSCFIREAGIRPSAQALQKHKWILMGTKPLELETDDPILSSAKFNSLRKARENEKPAAPKESKFGLFSKGISLKTFSGDHNAPISGRLMGEKKHKEKHHKREASKTEAQNAKDSGRKHTSRSHSKKESSTIAKESGSHGKSSKKKKEQVEKAAQVVLPKADTKSTIKESAKESKARAKEERKEKRKSKNLALHPAVTKPAGSGMSAGQGAASSNATLSASQHKETQLVVKTETSSPVKPVTPVEKSAPKSADKTVDSLSSFSDDDPAPISPKKPTTPTNNATSNATKPPTGSPAPDPSKKPATQGTPSKQIDSLESFSDEGPGEFDLGSLANDLKGLTTSLSFLTKQTGQDSSSSWGSSEEDAKPNTNKPVNKLTASAKSTPTKASPKRVSSSSSDTFSDDAPMFPEVARSVIQPKKKIDMSKLAEDEDDADFDDVLDEIVIPLDENRQAAKANKSQTPVKGDEIDDWSLEDGSDAEAMPTASLKQTIEVNLFKNHMQELSLKVKDNINVVLGSEGDQIKACEYLLETFDNYPDQRERILSEGILPILELLQIDNDHILAEVIHVVFEIIAGNVQIQSSIVLAGAIPVVLRFWGLQTGQTKFYSAKVREAAVHLLQDMMKTLGKDVLLKNFIGSWQSIIGLLVPDYLENKICCLFGVQLITDIFRLTDQSQMKGKSLGFTFKKQNFCRLWARAGLLPPLLRAFERIKNSLDNEKIADEDEIVAMRLAQENISEIILEFSKIIDSAGDSVIRTILVQEAALTPLLAATFPASKKLLPDNILLNMLKVLKEVSSSGATLEPLQKAGLIQALISLLDVSEQKSSGLTTMHSHYIFQTLCQLCGYSASGLEIAVTSGLIPHIKKFIVKKENKSSKGFALQMLFAISKCRPHIRPILWQNNLIEYYVDQFSQGGSWIVIALEALSTLSDDYVSSVLAKPQYSRRLHDVFVKSFDEDLDFFCNIVPSFYKMIKSKDLILSLYDIGFFSVLLERVKYFYKLLAISKNRSRNDVFLLLFQLVPLFYETVENKKEMVAKFNLKEVIKSVHTGGDLSMIDRISSSLVTQFSQL